jgi:hypothetical protein
MFMIYPSIVQLVRSPIPLGFGGNSEDAANVQLPFMIMFLVFASITPFIINRVGSMKPTIIGGLISLIGAIGLLTFHSTEFAVSANLRSNCQWSITHNNCNMEYGSVVIAKRVHRHISRSGRPFVVYRNGNRPSAGRGLYGESQDGRIHGSYPTPGSYNLVFLTAGLMSAVSVVFALALRNRPASTEIQYAIT